MMIDAQKYTKVHTKVHTKDQTKNQVKNQKKEDTPEYTVKFKPFDEWANFASVDQDLNAKSIGKYKALWGAWVDWLGQRGLTWKDATGDVISLFFLSPAPGMGGRRKAVNSACMSMYTKQRYWRLLVGVYARAVKMNEILGNPVLDVPLGSRPQISPEDRKSQILEPGVMEKLRDPSTLLCITKTSFNWWHIRDRALMAILVDSGISTSELLKLKGCDIKRSNWQDILSPKENTYLILNIKPNEDNQGRSLILSERYESILIEWFSIRRDLLLKKSLKFTSMEDRKMYMMEHDENGPLFFARRSATSGENYPEMPPVTVYYTVSNALKRFRSEYMPEQMNSKRDALKTPIHFAAGAGIIRNSIIRLWKIELGDNEAAKRAGIKNINPLRY